MNKLFVFDTNTLISAALLAGTTRKALDKAIENGQLAASRETMQEVVEALFRKKFDKYFLNDDERWVIVDKIEANAIFFTPAMSIADCRDPKDNKFLELAVESDAACLITGDDDLLVLHPFRGIPILNASDFLNRF
jgi:uncharacterized protein